MSLRMHRCDDGRDGLAAFCEVCGERIREDGYVVWNPEDVSDWLVVHQVRCDPGYPGSPLRQRYSYSLDLDVAIVYPANSVSADLEDARRRVGVFAQL